ncbi:hypothetical protein ACFO3U_10945 [Flavobacterium ponti]|jgi:hypothetical protein|uniref:Lipoprotein n=1 Tax=Flavobacterium ponti TaxID=665133 RepID=A0ABV9P883_9FLAO
MKNIFALLFIVISFESCVDKKVDKKEEEIKQDTISPKIQMIERGGIIMPDRRDEL